jgi:hypothetical protein
VQSNILAPSFIPLGSETVHGAVDPFPTPVQHVGVDHRRLHVPMPEQFLNCADGIAVFQQIVVIECRSMWQLAGLASLMFRAASLTARCRTDSCR